MTFRTLKISRLLSVLFLLLLSGLSFYLWLQSSGTFSSLRVKKGDDKTFTDASNPYLTASVHGKNNFFISADWVLPLVRTSRLHIVPDDCIKSIRINGIEVPLESYEGRLCDISHGVDIELGSALRRGSNTVELELSDFGRQYGVYFKQSTGGWGAVVLLSMTFISLLMAASLIFGTLSWTQNILLIVGFFARLMYLSGTTYPPKIYDVDGHLDYMREIINGVFAPAASACFECYQPPGYYLIASPILALASKISIDPYTAVQFLSCLLFCGALFLFLKTLNLWFSNAALLIPASVLVVFWPSGIRDSARIGNDIFFYFMAAAVIFSFSFWLKDKQAVRLKIALLVSWLAWFSKLSIAPVSAAVFLMLLVSWYRYQKSNGRGFFSGLFSAGRSQPILSFLFVVNLITPVFYLAGPALQNNSLNWVENTHQLDAALKMNVSSKTFLCFDAKTFLTQAFSNAYNDSGGRQCFWNFMGKTSLFYNTGYNSHRHQNLDLTMSWLLLFFSLFLICRIGWLIYRSKFGEFHLFFTSLIVLFVLALAMNLIVNPYACSEDFRYILPVILPAAAMIAEVKAMKYPILLFAICSVSFVIVSLF